MARMKRLQAGLYAGEDLRAERVDGAWRFEIQGRQLGVRGYWIEYNPGGFWCAIGSWKTIDAGEDVGDRLRRGTHFWDGDTNRCRLYSENAYAQIRGEGTGEAQP